MSTVQLLAPRILALPADVRRALARVYGPGWVVSDPWCKGALPGIACGWATGALRCGGTSSRSTNAAVPPPSWRMRGRSGVGSE